MTRRRRIALACYRRTHPLVMDPLCSTLYSFANFLEAYRQECPR